MAWLGAARAGRPGADRRSRPQLLPASPAWFTWPNTVSRSPANSRTPRSNAPRSGRCLSGETCRRFPRYKAAMTDLSQIHSGDRVTGAPFATRSAVWGSQRRGGDGASARQPDRHRCAARRRLGGGCGDRGQHRAGLPGADRLRHRRRRLRAAVGPEGARGGRPERLRPLAGVAQPGDAPRARQRTASSTATASPRSRRRARSTAGGCCTSATAS